MVSRQSCNVINGLVISTRPLARRFFSLAIDVLTTCRTNLNWITSTIDATCTLHSNDRIA